MRIATPQDCPQIEVILSKAMASGESMFQRDINYKDQPGFFILDDHGVFWCNPLDDATLEVHATFEPGHRGRYVRDITRAGQRMIFTELGVERLLTKCKIHHQYVVEFARWMGFKQIGIMDDTILMECSLDSYIMLDNELCDFAIDVDFPLPPVCPQGQTNYAGFFVLCCRTGLMMKGLATYNRMAALLGWEPLLLTSSEPILLTIGGRQFSPTEMTEA